MYFGARRFHFDGVHEGWERQAFIVGCLSQKEDRIVLWTVQTLSNYVIYDVHKTVMLKTSDIFCFALYVIPDYWGRLWMLYSVMDAVQCNPVGTIPSVTDRQTFWPVLGPVCKLFCVGGCRHRVFSIQNSAS